jgi:quercetin dioxygenase-like cupin family protein
MRSPLRQHRSRYVVAILAIAFASIDSTATTLHAQQGKKAGDKKGDSLTWGPAPAVFPAGAKMAVESGDPTKSGEFVVRFRFPAGYKIPPHFHPTDEHIRVLAGTFLVGMGDKLDVAATKPLAVGDTAMMPAKMHHFAIAKTAATVRVRSQGPFAMTYVNPADTPKP